MSEQMGLALGGGTGTGTTSTAKKRRRHPEHRAVQFGAGMRSLGPNGHWTHREEQERRFPQLQEQENRRAAALERQEGRLLGGGPGVRERERLESASGLTRIGSSGGCGCPPGEDCDCPVTHRRVVHHHRTWPADVLAHPSLFGLKRHGPSLSHNDRNLPHPNAAPGARYWLWHPTHRRWVHIHRVVHHAGASHLVDKKLLPEHWPAMELGAPPPGARPPPIPHVSLHHAPIVIPLGSSRGQAQHLGRRQQTFVEPMTPAQHLAEQPGEWRLIGDEWKYVEPQTPVLGRDPTHFVTYHPSQAPASAYEPRPHHIPGRAFWPNEAGHLQDGRGRAPSNAPTNVPIPPQVHAIRGKASEMCASIAKAAHERGEKVTDTWGCGAGFSGVNKTRDLIRGMRRTAY